MKHRIADLTQRYTTPAGPLTHACLHTVQPQVRGKRVSRPGLFPSRRRVLVVDDTRITRHLLAGTLANYGCVCFTAEDGSLAWQIVLREYLDAIVTDIEMPVSDGFQLISRVRSSSNPRIRQVPILVCSSRASECTRLAKQVGANQVLEKPINAHLLKTKLDALASR